MPKFSRFLTFLFCLSTIFITLLGTNVSNSVAQETDSDNVFVVIRTLTNGDVEVVRINSDDTSTVLISLSASECFGINEYMPLVAVSERNNPTSIDVFDLQTGQLLRSIPWQNEWLAACGFFWVDDFTDLFMTTLINGSAWVGTKFNVLTGMSLTEDRSIDPIATSLPNLTPIGSLYFQSPNSDLVVYMRCDFSGTRGSPYGGEQCDGGSRAVVYDLATGADIVVLDNSILGRAGPLGVMDFISAFSWSPSGQFLAYIDPIEDTVVIYDTLTNTFQSIDIDVTGQNIWQFFGQRSLQWSPDETKLAFWLHRRFQGDPRIGFYNRSNDSFQSFVFNEPISGSRQSSWRWLSDSQSVGVLLDNNELIEIGLDGTRQQITDNVVQLYTIRSALNPPSFTSLTLVNANTDTDIRTLNSTDTVDIANNGISIRANTDPATVGSVVFYVDGEAISADNDAPYTLDVSLLPVGMVELVVTPHSGSDGTGMVGTPMTIQLEIIDSG